MNLLMLTIIYIVWMCPSFTTWQPPWHVILLVYKPLQDHEVHSLAPVQVDFHFIDYPSAGDPVPRDPVLLLTGKIT